MNNGMMSPVAVGSATWRRRRARALLTAALSVTLVLSPLSTTSAQADPKPVPGGRHLTPQAEKLDNVGGVARSRAWPVKQQTTTGAPAPAWPRAGTATVTLPAADRRSGSASVVRAGLLPVRLARGSAPGDASVSQVSVRLLDRASTPAAWRDGLLLRVSDAGSAAATGGSDDRRAMVSVDYRSFQTAYGGDWASRLRLWQLPECALTRDGGNHCAATRLASQNRGGAVTAEVPLRSAGSPAGTLVALAAEPSGPSGDFTATSLLPSATWAPGGSSGDFAWSYPLAVPATAGGPAPIVTLSYSSSSVDGRSEATNNQPSWMGEGFEYWPGYIERQYASCLEDQAGSANNDRKTGDLCWRSDNATMSLNGKAAELVYEKGKGWHSRSEDASKIEKLPGADNGAQGGEHWKVTDADGVQYFFGLNALSGQSARTQSTWTVPVAGNHDGEPCHAASFTASFCSQAWRWNLDYVVDPRGNTMSYWYEPESNQYARNLTDTDNVSYVRGGTLKRIDYGTWDRSATDRSAIPTAQVSFSSGDRCRSDCGTHDAAHWPDTPWDQECKADASSCNDYSPTFWSTKRLAKITTRVWDTTGTSAAWQDVKTWTLDHGFPATGDGSDHPGLWLNSITQAGHVGGAVTMPPVTFEPVSLPNRVLTKTNTSNNWQRIGNIVNETGAKIQVIYSLPGCTASNLPDAAHTNTKLCYPVIGPDPSDPDGPEITEWWHKYVVKQVSESDLRVMAGGSDRGAPVKNKFYTYVGDPAWHYADDDGLVKPKRKTWNQFRGYATVETRTGDAPNQTLVVTRYLRGMHGDRAAPAGGTRDITVTASIGESVKDEDQFAGMTREKLTYDGTTSKPVSKTVNVPWLSPATASRTINGDTVTARFTDNKIVYEATALGASGQDGWRTTRKETRFSDSYGTVDWSQDDGDIAKTGDEQCARYSYNRNTDKNLVKTVKQTTTTALTCNASATSTDDVIADERNYYDNATSPDTAPTAGAVTKVERLKDWTPSGGTSWQTYGQTTYDAFGRPLTAIDVRGNTTTTAYSPASGIATKVTTKTADPNGGADWTSTLDAAPYWDLPVHTTDPNNRQTNAEYDPLGRITRAWNVGWDKASHPTNPSVEYSYVFSDDRSAYPYIRTRKLNAGGGYLTTYQIFDALLRPRQTQSPAIGGGRVVTDTIHDNAGRVAVQYAPHAEPGDPAGQLWWEPEWSVPALTKTTFDNASRPVSENFYGTDGVTNLVLKWRTTTAYTGDTTSVTPPEGGTPTTTVTDAQNRTIELREHTTDQGVAGPYRSTRYTYNRKGQLWKVTDPGGNEWTYTFDVKGRQIEQNDPDKGRTTSEYNDLDDLTKTTDANGATLAHQYDKLGRKIGLYDTSISAATLRADWKYDKLFTGETIRGQPTESTRYEPPGSANAYKRRVIGFTARYQPTGVSYLIPQIEGSGLAGTWTYGYSYSAFDGSPTGIGYPAAGGLTAETVTTKYNQISGLPTTLETNLIGIGTYVSGQTYTAFGEPDITTRKVNGSVYVEDSTEYDLTTRRINRNLVQPETATGTVSDRRFQYHESGAIKSINDTPSVGSPDTQCFRQDHLGRLTTAWTPKAGITCVTDPTIANLGGPAPYWLDWTTDLTGNRTKEVSHSPTGDITRNLTLPSSGAGVARPHAHTNVTTTKAGQPAVTTTYTYDKTGNTVCRPTGDTANTCQPSANSQVLGWDTEGRLATVTTAGQSIETNIYDPDGVRWIRRDATGTTLYLPDQEVRREGTSTTGTRYYSFGDKLVACRNPTGLSWLYTDHQGTQNLAINANSQTVTARRQTPYGTPRDPQPVPWVNPEGFVGGDNDPSGLVLLGARHYDTALGRFISVDPLQDPNDPEQWNAYAYANNSPVTLSDPTGAIAREPAETGGGDSTSSPTEPGKSKKDSSPNDKVVRLGKHVVIHQSDPRYQALKAAYDHAARNWLQNWKNEDRIWQSVCSLLPDLCPKELKELVKFGALNDNLAHETGSVLIALDGPLRRLMDPKSMVGATETELRAMVPDDWVEQPLRKGDGVRFGSPAKGSRPIGGAGFAEFNRGVPTSPDELHRGNFIRVSSGGLEYRVAARGNPIIEKGPLASIQGYRSGLPGGRQLPWFRRPWFRIPPE